MKIIGQLVCGPGEAERWLDLTLKEFSRLCDDVIVCLCNAGPKEKALVRKYDFRSYEDNREWGKFQPAIKTDLLRRIRKLSPDWILVLDADETVPTLDRATIEALAQSRRAMQLYVVNLWNDEEHYSKTRSFWNVRLYKPKESPDSQFLKKPVHCGNAPPFFYGVPARESYIPHILLHRGLLDPQERLRKYARYQEYDPKAIHKGVEYYDGLLQSAGATLYAQHEVILKLQHYVSTITHTN